jgi:hypothetical protein
MPLPRTPLSDESVLARLSTERWYTAGQVADDLRQCGPLAFAGDDPDGQHTHFNKLMLVEDQYQAVYNVLMRLKRRGKVDTALGDDKGREVRVFRILTEENRNT